VNWLFPKQLIDRGFPGDPVLWYTALGILSFVLDAAALRLVEARIDGPGVARRAYVLFPVPGRVRRRDRQRDPAGGAGRGRGNHGGPLRFCRYHGERRSRRRPVRPTPDPASACSMIPVGLMCYVRKIHRDHEVALPLRRAPGHGRAVQRSATVLLRS
jgi:hypothetical protein